MTGLRLFSNGYCRQKSFFRSCTAFTLSTGGSTDPVFFLTDTALLSVPSGKRPKGTDMRRSPKQNA